MAKTEKKRTLLSVVVRGKLIDLGITFADDESSDLDNLFRRPMPWIGDDICMKDPQALPGLSLVQWMNMQQNPSLANTIQPNYMHSMSGSVLQNLSGTDLSRQLGLSSPQIPQTNNMQFNCQRLPQQAQQPDHLPKLPSTLNPLGSVIQSQQQLGDITQQSRQNVVNQTLPSNQVQAQMLQPQSLVQTNNILQQQPSIQNHQPHRSVNQNLQPQQQQQHQQQSMGQNQQQNLIQPQLPDQVNQQLQMSENQIQIQLFQKLQQQQQQQQQSLLAQQSALQQPAQFTQLQDPQRQPLDMSQNFSRPLTPTQMLEVPQATSTSLPQSIPHQMTRNNSHTNIRFSHPPQQPKLQHQQSGVLPEISGHMGLPLPPTTNQLSTAGSSIVTGTAGAGQSAITDDLPSCSTSPSTNNCPNVVQPVMNGMPHRSTAMGEDMAHSAATILCPGALETISSNANMVKDLQQKSDVKPSLNISKNQNQGFFAPQYLNGAAAQTDYLDTSSSTTSVCLSQNDAHLQQNNNPVSSIPNHCC